jgi:hypothetical protein
MIYFPTYAIRCYWSIPCVFGNPERTNSVKIASKHIKFVAMKNLLLSIFALSILLFTSEAFAQGVGIGATDFAPGSDALLELRSTNKGFLTPRMTEAQKNAIASPTAGLMIYQTNNTTGFYYYSGSVWLPFVAADNLGNHLATQDIVMAGNKIVNVAGGTGIKVTDAGNVGIGIGAGVPAAKLDVIAGDIQLSSSGGTSYGVKFQSPSALYTSTIKAGVQTGNLSYTLPIVAPSAGQVLSSDAAGVMSWTNANVNWSRVGNSGTVASTSVIGSAANNNFLGTTDNVSLALVTNNLERMRITNAGNIGVGVLAPSQKFQVNDGNIALYRAGGTAGELHFQGTGAGISSLKAGAQGGTSISYTLPTTAPTAGYVLASDASGNMSWTANNHWALSGNGGTTASTAVIGSAVNNSFIGTTDNVSVAFATNNLERMRITNGGNVGIGVQAAVQKLQVNDGNIALFRAGGTAGELQFQGTGAGISSFKAGAQGGTNITYTLPTSAPGAGQYLSTDASGNLSWATGTSGWGLTGNNIANHSTSAIGTAPNNSFFGTTSGKDIVFATFNRERMRLSYYGYLGMGTLTPGNRFEIIRTGADLVGGGDDDFGIKSYGTGMDPQMFMQVARGTQAAPTDLVNGDLLGNISWWGQNNGGGSLMSQIQALYTGDGTTNASELRLTTSGWERVRLDKDGNMMMSVGASNYITNPYASLHLYGDGKSGWTPGGTTEQPSPSAGPEIGFSRGGFYDRLGAAIQFIDYDAYSGGLNFLVHKGQRNNSGGDFLDHWPTDVIEAMTIVSNGMIGVGTTDPLAKFDIMNGNLRISRTGVPAGKLEFQGTAAGVTSFTAGAQGATNINYTLPIVAPTAGQVLSSDAAGVMSWTANSDWSRVGNSGTTASTSAIGVAANNNFIGTTNNVSLVFATNNLERLRISNGGNVGIGTIAPDAALVVNGAVAVRRSNVAFANGANTNMNVGDFGFIKITGPTGAFSVTGLTGGVDGRIVTLYNSTAQNMTITNDATSTAANRILTLTGANIVTVGTGSVTLQYDSHGSRWIVIASQL